MRWVSLATTFLVPNFPNLVHPTQIKASRWAETNLTYRARPLQAEETVHGKRETSKCISIGVYLQNM